MAEWQEDSYGKIMFNTVLPHGYMRLLGIHRTANWLGKKEKKNHHLHSLLKFKLETLGFYSDSDLTTLRCETKTPADRERAAKWHITMWAVCWIGSSRWQHRCFSFKFRRLTSVLNTILAGWPTTRCKVYFQIPTVYSAGQVWQNTHLSKEVDEDEGCFTPQRH